MKRVIISLVPVICILLLLTSACTAQAPSASAAPAQTKSSATTKAPAAEPVVLTLEELSAFNGENGNPAYIAVDGVIYDVTNVPQWKGGLHNGFTAGNDWSDQIKKISPHGVSKLKGIPVVGTLAK